MYRRFIHDLILEALADTSVIVINGARQTGKSTLCRHLMKEALPQARYVTFDDVTALAAARADPAGFIAGLPPHVVLDEIQRAPEILLSIKKSVDEDRKKKRFILTGSADVMTLPKLSESLAGRMEIHTLHPLSQEEIAGEKSNFLKALTGEDADFNTRPVSRGDLLKRMTVGGYPEALERENPERRTRWFQSYIHSILQKDIRELANIEGLSDIPDILRLIAARAANLLNLTDISRLSGVSATTLNRYYALLRHVFLIAEAPAWTPNIEGRLVKSPKVFLNDSGLLCYLRGETPESLMRARTNIGAVTENFVFNEISKHLDRSHTDMRLYHFRTHKGRKVDFILENNRKDLFAVEVKAAESVKSDDFKGLRYLKSLRPEHFRKGVVLYTGAEIVPFGSDLFAVPIAALFLRR